MTAQSLRGMADSGPLHWRGDRTGSDVPGGDALDEREAFERFNPATVKLLGRGREPGVQDRAPPERGPEVR